MSVAERNRAQIGDTPVDPGVSIREIPVIEDLNPGSAKNLYRGDVVPEVAGQTRQAVTRADAEVVSGEVAAGVNTGPAARIRAVIPRRVPCLRPGPYAQGSFGGGPGRGGGGG